MQAPYFIELLDRAGEIKARHRFDALPISIGRAYDNDLILDDPHVAAHHAIIALNEAGMPTMRDLDSKNGMLQQGKRVQFANLNDEPITLGRTQLRVRDVNFSVSDEITSKHSHQWEGWPFTLIAISMLTVSTLVSYWLENKSEFSFISYLFNLALVLGLVLIWSGSWAFANRVMSSQARFGRHLFIVASAFLLLDAWSLLSATLGYSLSLPFLVRYGSHINVAIAAGMIFFHLHTINQAHPKRLAAICTIFAFLGSGLILLSNYQRSGDVADNLYMSTLMPPAMHLTKDHTVTEFMQDSASMQKALEQARKKPARQEAFLTDD